MILRIVKAKVCGPHGLELVFNDGVRKRVNVKPLLKGPVFKPLLSASFFSKGILEAESGTVVWPNGADLAPEALHELPAASPNSRSASAKKKRAVTRT